ncbi:AB-hydrolase YheT [Rickenella mellea]|uniref:AB-hydrolase YheT n=1 Tax=Rickenella mellea TaxID=50990 RepID=A0A4Y7QK57_9AGAM|nr:AB-hydrolase YheT [Rickenella mellea]
MGLSFSSFTTSNIPTLYQAPSPAYLSVHSQDDPNNTERTTMTAFLETHCPSLFKPFHPAWWLNSGHLQTAYCVFGDFTKVDKIVYDRKLLRLLDGGTIGLDFTPPVSERTVKDDVPIIVVLHGLTGGSYESYVRGILVPAVTPKDDGGLGFRGVVVNFRGCAGVPLTSAQLYSAGHTDDLRQALIYISKAYPNAPLVGVGFSLGANVLVRYLSEEGNRSRLQSGCALGCPWNLVNNSDRLQSNWFRRQLYSKGMGGNLVKLLQRHLEELATFGPDSRLTAKLPELFAIKSPTLLQVDARVTSIAGGSSPPFPFPTAHDYYKWASSHHCLPDVQVPLLAINAADDPIVHEVPLEVGRNGRVVLFLTKGGGHLGWFESSDHWREVQRWVTRPVYEWLRATAESLVPDLERPRDIVERDGWISEVGRDNLGVKELANAGHVDGAHGDSGLLAGL